MVRLGVLGSVDEQPHTGAAEIVDAVQVESDRT
jgi:hypothetical protein